jgi:hypothetical protein
MYDRIVDGIGSVLLTLKKRPVIRYSQTCARCRPVSARGDCESHRTHERARSSDTAQRIAQDVRRLTYEQACDAP